MAANPFPTDAEKRRLDELAGLPDEAFTDDDRILVHAATTSWILEMASKLESGQQLANTTEDRFAANILRHYANQIPISGKKRGRRANKVPVSDWDLATHYAIRRTFHGESKSEAIAGIADGFGCSEANISKRIKADETKALALIQELANKKTK